MSAHRARIIVTTDPELDDLNSMLRLLLYSNEIDIAALVYSASQFHHSGDPARGVAPHRWPEPGARMHIDQALDAYEAVHENLVRHDPRYPSPERLRALVATGNIAEVGDTREPTAGSDLVRDVLLGDAPGRVFAQAWGGTNTIARALMSIEDEYRGTPEWDEIYALIVGRTVITSYGEQDDTFSSYIRPVWPELEFRDVATAAWGYFAWHVVPDDAQQYLSDGWTREHVSSVGAIGAAYRVWGDGKHMAAGFDDEDYFGVVGASAEALRERGFKLWAPLQAAGAWISEGDSSNFAMHIDNGLRNAEDPAFGGWGGRQVPHPDDAHRWDSAGSIPWTPGAPIVDAGDASRWFGAFQRDFAARLQWTVTSDPASANHAPRVSVETLDRTVSPGEHVELGFTVTDPDGDDVTVRAFQDRGSECQLTVVPGACTIQIPADAPAGSSIHIIIEAVDGGAPALTGYARVVLTVE
ncbi:MULTISPECIES: nucleoside hydrolase-like domain-containing protein [unclassified Microbacterium]|uniref:nucleoside hydrolase-like domain-containing protein n=1 Tax=unclassified Microbacterium TaxID=2609290 RepID=UPI001BE7A5F7|nr:MULTISPECIES: nucleoside hydrolase-like domain-containing protein [unclassified Microbacterium]MBT2486489.1 DUF1593 domain-containing protein [Microbacterium sp. ISL-108]